MNTILLAARRQSPRWSVTCSLLALIVGCGGSRPDDKTETSGGAGSSSIQTTQAAGAGAANGGGAGGATSSSAGGGGAGGVASSSAGGGGAGGDTSGFIMGQAGAAYAGTAGSTSAITQELDWNGVIGTGQSLSVGTLPALSTTQPYNNLMLSLGTLGNLGVPPWAPDAPELSMVDLVQPMRTAATGFPSPYPRNITGETPYSAIANQVSAMALYYGGIDYVSVPSAVGESGQGMVALVKPVTLFATIKTTAIGRAYDASMYEVTAIKRLATAANKTYGVRAIVMTHGETDSGSSTYKNELIQLQADYDTDIKAITGQTQNVPMFLSQQHAYPQNEGARPLQATLFQWQLGVEKPEAFVCTGPKYQYPGVAKKDGIHLSAYGYRLLGEKIGQVYYERIVLGRDWKPLQPETITRSGQVITVNFHVPVPPLVWDETLPEPPAFPNGRGFEVRASSTKIAIEKVEIDGSSVKITCSDPLPTTALTVGYAMTAQATKLPVASYAFRWGQLKDSDPFVGASSLTIQPNYAVMFEMTVP